MTCFNTKADTMKPIHLLLLLFFVYSIAFISCERKDNTSAATAVKATVATAVVMVVLMLLDQVGQRHLSSIHFRQYLLAWMYLLGVNASFHVE